MSRTLLIGHPGVTWREWLKGARGQADLLVLDPGDASLGPPARLVHLRGGKPLATRFFGSLDAQRSPHVLVAMVAQSLAMAPDDLIVQTFAYRPTPVLRQTLSLIAQVLRPDRILVPEGSPLGPNGMPIGPETIQLPADYPPIVHQAQRKAQWMKHLAQCHEHDVDWTTVATEGARLGSGEAVTQVAGLAQAVHVERQGATLLAVCQDEPTETEVARALDLTNCQRAQIVAPKAYDGLVSSFARQAGDDFGFGIVLGIDWESRRMRLLNTAIPPAPIRILRLGSLRISPQGDERGEVKSWQV